jgi:hypothetical protein
LVIVVKPAPEMAPLSSVLASMVRFEPLAFAEPGSWPWLAVVTPVALTFASTRMPLPASNRARLTAAAETLPSASLAEAPHIGRGSEAEYLTKF